MIILYRLFLWLYRFAIHVASLFNGKAKLWIDGRSGLLEKLEQTLPAGELRLWMHCASLGEFEQGRPVLEALRQQYPHYKIVLTFFSPSGYEIRKSYEGADYIFYLPMDGPDHARRFVAAVQPKLVLFVKYEFWHYYLQELEAQQISTMLISAAFRKDQAFFKWYGGFFRNMLCCFTHILVQDVPSKQLLESLRLPFVAVTGDTRYDRVAQIARSARILPEIEAFRGDSPLMIGGSTWPGDEQILKTLLPALPETWKLILAPHEIDEAHLSSISGLFGDAAVLYSDWKAAPVAGKRVLVIDNIGMLSSLYRYGAIAFVGGGYNKGGIHNVLEPAVFGLPVMIGPVYEKFVEAVALVQAGFVFPVPDAPQAQAVLQELLNDARRQEIHTGLAAFMREHTGATGRILDLIKQEKLL